MIRQASALPGRRSPSCPFLPICSSKRATAPPTCPTSSAARACGWASPACRAPARPSSSRRWPSTSPRVAGGGRKNPLPVFRVAAEGRLIGGAAGAAARRPCRALRLRGPSRRADRTKRRRPALAAIDAADFRIAAAAGFRARRVFAPAPSHFTIDIVDYPGEWLLDLPLLEKSFAQWSRETFESSAAAARAPLAADWRGFAATLDPSGPEDEALARRAAESFTAYLRAAARRRLRALDPAARPFSHARRPRGIAGADLRAPALARGRRGDARHAGGDDGAALRIVQEPWCSPFFRDHFARLDRQIVLVDALAALNSGPAALRDLQNAL